MDRPLPTRLAPRDGTLADRLYWEAEPPASLEDRRAAADLRTALISRPGEWAHLTPDVLQTIGASPTSLVPLRAALNPFLGYRIKRDDNGRVWATWAPPKMEADDDPGRRGIPLSTDRVPSWVIVAVIVAVCAAAAAGLILLLGGS
jgi:hypothetical protein